MVDKCKTKFKRFLETFVQTSMDEDEMIDGLDETQPLYMQKIDEVPDISTFTFNRSFYGKFYFQS